MRRVFRASDRDASAWQAIKMVQDESKAEVLRPIRVLRFNTEDLDVLDNDY